MMRIAPSARTVSRSAQGPSLTSAKSAQALRPNLPNYIAVAKRGVTTDTREFMTAEKRAELQKEFDEGFAVLHEEESHKPTLRFTDPIGKQAIVLYTEASKEGAVDEVLADLESIIEALNENPEALDVLEGNEVEEEEEEEYEDEDEDGALEVEGEEAEELEGAEEDAEEEEELAEDEEAEEEFEEEEEEGEYAEGEEENAEVDVAENEEEDLAENEEEEDEEDYEDEEEEDFNALEEFIEENEFHPVTNSFLSELSDTNRFSLRLLTQIASKFDQLVAYEEKEVDVTVTAVSEEAVEQLIESDDFQNTVSRFLKSNETPRYKTVIDPSLLSGHQVEIGGFAADFSLKTQIGAEEKNLRKQLQEPVEFRLARVRDIKPFVGLAEAQRFSSELKSVPLAKYMKIDEVYQVKKTA